jgi:hypothetical protein
MNTPSPLDILDEMMKRASEKIGKQLAEEFFAAYE